jgi:hypothetical protein
MHYACTYFRLKLHIQYADATKWKFPLYFVTHGIDILVLQKILSFFSISNGLS